MTPVDLEILNSLNFDRERICNIYGVDPILFSTQNSSYNNKREAYKSLVMNVIIPLLNLYRDELNRWIVQPYTKGSEEFYIDYDLSVYPELKDDLKTEAETLDALWWWTPNMKLAYQGEPISQDPNMDKVYIPTKYQSLDDMNVATDTFNNPQDFDTEGN